MTHNFFNLGLIGYPLGHSLSPQLHEAALREAGLAGEYKLYPIRPSPPDNAALAALMKRVQAGELHGFNVTIPHKQTVIPLLDGLTPGAETIQAVNTIWLENGRLWGDNTDTPGFLTDLRLFIGDGYGKRPCALVLGAGGSARAVVYALLQDNWTVTIAARRRQQAEVLANDLRDWGQVNAITLTSDDLALSSLAVGLIVNTTPVGMTPHANAVPWPDDLPLPANCAIYDLVYNPPHTQLTQTAQAANLPAITGLGMLIEQASLAFTRWTGITVAREVWFNAVVKHGG